MMEGSQQRFIKFHHLQRSQSRCTSLNRANPACSSELASDQLVPLLCTPVSAMTPIQAGIDRHWLAAGDGFVSLKS